MSTDLIVISAGFALMARITTRYSPKWDMGIWRQYFHGLLHNDAKYGLKIFITDILPSFADTFP